MVKFVKKRQWSHYILLLANSDSTNYKHFRNILRLFDVLPNFPSTTSKTMRDCPVPPPKMRILPILAKTPSKAENNPHSPRSAPPHTKTRASPHYPANHCSQNIRNTGATTPITAPKELCMAVELFPAIQKIFNVT